MSYLQDTLLGAHPQDLSSLLLAALVRAILTKLVDRAIAFYPILRDKFRRKRPFDVNDWVLPMDA